LPNAGIIADRHLNDTESTERTFQNYFDRPAVRHLLELKAAKDIGAPGAERSQVAYPQTVQKPDQEGCQAVTEGGVPRHRPGDALLPEARTEGDIGTPLNDGGQEKWEFSRSIAVVAVKEDDDIGSAGIREPGQTSTTVSAARFVEDASSHLGSDLGCPVG